MTKTEVGFIYFRTSIPILVICSSFIFDLLSVVVMVPANIRIRCSSAFGRAFASHAEDRVFDS